MRLQISVSATDREHMLTSLSPSPCAVTYRQNVDLLLWTAGMLSVHFSSLSLSVKPRCALNLKASYQALVSPWHLQLTFWAMRWYISMGFASTSCTSCISSVFSTSVQMNVWSRLWSLLHTTLLIRLALVPLCSLEKGHRLARTSCCTKKGLGTKNASNSCHSHQVPQYLVQTRQQRLQFSRLLLFLLPSAPRLCRAVGRGRIYFK